MNLAVFDADAVVRWDDPVFRIEWPSVSTVISDRYRSYGGFAA